MDLSIAIVWAGARAHSGRADAIRFSSAVLRALRTPLLGFALFAMATAGFASTLDRWAPYGNAGYTVDGSERAGALKCVLSTDGVAGASQTVMFNQTAATPIQVSGWSKAADVSGVADNDYSVYVDLTYTDGTPLWGQIVPFDAGTHDWQQRRLVIAPSKPVRSIVVYALFRHHTGTVWFDDFDAHQLDSGKMFDGQEITPPPLRVNASGWFVRDVSSGSTTVRPVDAVDGLRLTQTVDKSGIIRARLTNASTKTRCVTVYYIEKYAPAKAVWWDDIRTHRNIAGRAEFSNVISVNVGASGTMSLYPFGCAGDRLLAIPPDLGPRVDRIGYNARLHLFYVAFDIALTPRGDRYGHDRADVAVMRSTVDPRWGFRDAAARYYRAFPETFRRRATADGIWMPFTAPSTVANVDDFHVAYHEGDNSVATDRQHGILSFRYIEPMTYWMTMPADTPRTYESAIAMLRSKASGPDGADSRSAQAVLSTGSMDDGGRLNVSFQNAPWCNGAVWVMNPNPAMASTDAGWTGWRLSRETEPSTGAGQPDGVYLDSLEAHADVLDYREESLRASTVPLTFTPTSCRPVVPTWFSVYEDTHRLEQDLHRRGKLLMANSTPWRIPIFCTVLDIAGTETDWNPGGQWQPDTDAEFNLRRTMSYHKPYLLLMNTDFAHFGTPEVERYFQRCLFYGVFPSFFSADAATHPYWESPDLYNRDRPMFEKYIPIISKLSHAGWEPMTDAWTDNDHVWVERYGKSFLTVMNAADKPERTTLTVDIGKLIGTSKTVTVDLGDPLSANPSPLQGKGSKKSYAVGGGVASIPIEVGAGEVRVVSIGRR